MTEQKLIIGNCLDVLRGMDAESIDVCVTSPPYWGLRDYKSEPVVWGGNPDCVHDWQEHIQPARGGVGSHSNVGANKDVEANNRGHPTTTHYCSRCGAWLGQLGLEPTPSEYIDHLCMIFDEVKRVLKPTGACWVNLGDTYAVNDQAGIKAKSLVQIPARFATAMIDRGGWIMRNKCIWQKPNAMPVSCKDRFTVDYEEFFFFTKEPKYYFAQQTEALRCPTAHTKFSKAKDGNPNATYSGREYDVSQLNGRNMRTVWSIPTIPSEEDHVAMFPPSLIETPIKACCPPGGVVLDPFCGSGTTLEYCRRHDINGVGIEINPDFKEMINKRSMMNIRKIDDFTVKEAEE